MVQRCVKGAPQKCPFALSPALNDNFWFLNKNVLPSVSNRGVCKVLQHGCYLQHFGDWERSRLHAVGPGLELAAIYNTD